MSSRPALLTVNHPLSYTSFSDSKPADKSSLADPQTLEDRVKYLYEHQQVTNLLNEYGYTLDVCMVEHSTAQKWADLFTDDCDVTYPFGNQKGKDGLDKWALNAETRFHRMLVSD